TGLAPYYCGLWDCGFGPSRKRTNLVLRKSEAIRWSLVGTTDCVANGQAWVKPLFEWAAARSRVEPDAAPERGRPFGLPGSTSPEATPAAELQSFGPRTWRWRCREKNYTLHFGR